MVGGSYAYLSEYEHRLCIPNPEVRDIWFALIKGFKWSGIGEGGYGKMIPDMNHRGKAVAPE